MRSVGPMSRAQILLRTGVLPEGPLPEGLQGPLAMPTITGLIASCVKSHYHWHMWTCWNAYYFKVDIKLCKGILRLALRQALGTPTITRPMVISGKAYYDWLYVNLFERPLWQGLPQTLQRPTMTGITWNSGNAHYDKAYINLRKGLLRQALRKPLRTHTKNRLT